MVRYLALCVTIAVLLVCLPLAAQALEVPQGKSERHAMGEFPYQEASDGEFTRVYGTMEGSVAWTKEKSPYLVVENVFVAENGALTIEPGVVVYVAHIRPGGYWRGINIAVHGRLTARGTSSTPITITVLDAPARRATLWGKIEVSVESKPSVIEWVIVEYANFGLELNGSVLVTNTLVRYCGTGFLLGGRFTGDVLNSISADNQYAGFRFDDTPPEASIMNCIAYHSPYAGLETLRSAALYSDHNLIFAAGARDPTVYKGMTPGPNDIVADPMFVDPENGDFALQADSPARGAGHRGADIGLAADSWTQEASDSLVEQWFANGDRELWQQARSIQDSRRGHHWRAPVLSYDLYKRVLARSTDENLRVQALCRLADIYMQIHEYESAFNSLIRARLLSRQPHLRDYARIRLADIYAAKGEHWKSLVQYSNLEWPHSLVWTRQQRARATLLAGKLTEAVEIIEEFDREWTRLSNMATLTRQAISGNRLRDALTLLDWYDDKPSHPHFPSVCLELAKRLQTEKEFTIACRLLERGVDYDPLSQEAPESLALLASIYSVDLDDAEEAHRVRVRLARNYYSGHPSVADAISHLDPSKAISPRGETVMLDSSIGLAMHYYGQRDIARAVHVKGHIVHNNDVSWGRSVEELTSEVAARYGLIILNGKSHNQEQIPDCTIDLLVAYVEDGGSLLVNSTYGAGPDYYDSLLGRFGLQYQDSGWSGMRHGVVGHIADEEVLGDLEAFYPMSPVHVDGGSGSILALSDDKPIVALARHGKGKVIICGLGSTFVTEYDFFPEAIKHNKRLLLRLTEFLLCPES